MNKAAFIREVVAADRNAGNGDRVLWSRHAIAKLVIERLERHEIEAALLDCILVEDYPAVARPLPDCLVLCYVGGAPVHATVALDTEHGKVLIVTVYVPDEQRWENDWKTRR